MIVEVRRLAKLIYISVVELWSSSASRIGSASGPYSASRIRVRIARMGGVPRPSETIDRPLLLLSLGSILSLQLAGVSAVGSLRLVRNTP